MYLNVQENRVDVSVPLDDIHDVPEHGGTNSEPPVGRQAAQSHDVELPSAVLLIYIYTATHGAHHDVVVVSKLGQLSGLQDVLQTEIRGSSWIAAPSLVDR